MSAPSRRTRSHKTGDAAKHADELHVDLEDRLREEGAYDLAGILVKCREPFKLRCVCCNKQVNTTKGCAKRWCPVCGPVITAKRYARIEPVARRMQWPLAVMLSMKNPKEVAGCIDKLKAAFRGFRRTQFWKSTVKGGYVGFEVTSEKGTPHIHLHCLIDCQWLAISTPEPKRGHTRAERERLCKMAQAELAAVWAGYLGQREAVVWVRRADKKALAETIKYPLKPSDLINVKCSASELIREIDKGRMVTPFGNCHGTSKAFLGRDEPTYKEKLCVGCLSDRSIVPETVYSRFFDTIYEDRINAQRGLRTQRTMVGLSPRHLNMLGTRDGWKDGKPPEKVVQTDDPDIPW